jgi:hypothetical protein
MKIQQQQDSNGCGIACLANLLNQPYKEVKREFEYDFYSIDSGIKIFDIMRYLEMKKLSYQCAFLNQNPKYHTKNQNKKTLSKIPGSITLIAKNSTYPVGHYLLRTSKGWIDPWYNFPDIHTPYAGIRRKLPGEA